LDLKILPEHLIVVGAGYVGLELGQLFRHLGSGVTLVQRGERLLRIYDPEIADSVGGMLQQQGIQVVTGTTFVRVEQSGSIKRLVVRVGDTEHVIKGDALLVATGRTPNTEALNLAAAAVTVGARGEIVVDDRLRTSNPRVLAAGDVTLGPEYVYVAAYEGALAAENALDGDRVLDLRAVPGVTFTTPSIATVGLTEAAARQAVTRSRRPSCPCTPCHGSWSTAKRLESSRWSRMRAPTRCWACTSSPTTPVTSSTLVCWRSGSISPSATSRTRSRRT